jgi:hypothetical protein
MITFKNEEEKKIFYAYILFHKEYSGMNVKDEKTKLNVHPGIETVLFLEGKIRERNKNGKVMRLSNVAEKDYYDYYSLEKTAEELYSEFSGMSDVYKEIIKENIEGKDFYDVKNPGEVFYAIYCLNDEEINKFKYATFLQSYLNPKITLNYSLFKSFFLIEGDFQEAFMEPKWWTGSSFLLNLFLYRGYYVKDKFIENKRGLKYLYDYVFHLKNEFLMNKIRFVRNIKKFFDLKFIPSELNNEKKVIFTPWKLNFFFPSNSSFLDRESIYRFLIRKYQSLTPKNLSSLIYYPYFEKKLLEKMFTKEKIMKDKIISTGVFLETDVSKNGNVKKFLEHFQKDLLLLGGNKKTVIEKILKNPDVREINIELPGSVKTKLNVKDYGIVDKTFATNVGRKNAKFFIEFRVGDAKKMSVISKYIGVLSKYLEKEIDVKCPSV